MSRWTAPDPEQVRHLVGRIAAGDRAARDELIERYLPLAGLLARKYLHRGIAQHDLEQTAAVALIQAVDRFDPERGVQFATYAAVTITGTLKRAFREQLWTLRVPRRGRDLHAPVHQARSLLSQRLGREPTVTEVAVSIGVEVDDVLLALEVGSTLQTASFDAPGRADAGRPLHDRFGSDDAALEQLVDRETIATLLQDLPADDRRLLQLIYEEQRPQREIGEELGLSQAQVSRRHTRLLQLLRQRVDRGSRNQTEVPPADRS